MTSLAPKVLTNYAGNACFLCEDDRDFTNIAGSTSIECERCIPTPVLDVSQSQRVIEHMSAHILRDPSVKSLDEPCGLCLRPYPLCKFYLKKTKGASGGLTVDKKRSECKYSIKFYYHTASKTTSSSPCSNVPLVCPLCPKSSPAVWKYNLRAHFVRCHPAHVSKKQYSVLWEIRAFERQEMDKIWSRRHKQVQKSCNEPGQQLVISESHISNRSFSTFVFPHLIDRVLHSDSTLFKLY